MSRYRFGGTADYVVSLGTDDAATLEPDTTVTCWNAASGGSQYTDLTDTDGTTPLASLTTDSTGAVPEFYGPDGTTEMYLDANDGSGPRRRTVTTDIRAYGDATFLPLAGGTVTSTITSSLSTATSVADASIVGGEVFDSYRRDVRGRQDWGPGNAARDTNQYRDGVNSLRTDGSYTIGATLKHLGTLAGFYGTTPVAKPTVSGSWADGSAAQSLAAALETLGLITDSTTA